MLSSIIKIIKIIFLLKCLNHQTFDNVLWIHELIVLFNTFYFDFRQFRADTFCANNVLQKIKSKSPFKTFVASFLLHVILEQLSRQFWSILTQSSRPFARLTLFGPGKREPDRLVFYSKITDFLWPNFSPFSAFRVYVTFFKGSQGRKTRSLLKDPD